MRPHISERPCPSVGPSIGQSVGQSVRNAFVKLGEKWILTEGRRGRMDEEEGWAQRKERHEERSNEESEKMKKVVKRMKNEKVA